VSTKTTDVDGDPTDAQWALHDSQRIDIILVAGAILVGKHDVEDEDDELNYELTVLLDTTTDPGVLLEKRTEAELDAEAAKLVDAYLKKASEPEGAPTAEVQQRPAREPSPDAPRPPRRRIVRRRTAGVKPNQPVVDRLLSIVARTRFRAPGTSPDPYADALILWLSVITEVRAIIPAEALPAVEAVYRDAVGAWLNPAGQPEPDGGDAALAEQFREVLS